MPLFEDVPFELKNYASPRSMAVGVADRRSGADTLLILTGTVILPPDIARHSDGRLQRKRIRFVALQTPKVLTSKAQIRSMQVTAAVASFHYEGEGERTVAIDQALIEWADDLKELRITVDTASQGAGALINRVVYNAFVLAQTG